MKNRSPRLNTAFLCISGLIAASSLSSAAVITWGLAQDTTATTDISTTGTTVFANAEGPTSGPLTVNGVVFSPADSLRTRFAPTATFSASGIMGGATTGDADFTALLDSISNTNDAAGASTASIDLGPLGTYTTGKQYQIQVFFCDQRTVGASNDKIITFGSVGGGNTVGLEGDTDDVPTDGPADITAPWGQFAIGTFTADGTAPDLTLSSSSGRPHLTAMQVRLIPEPSSLLLGALGTLVLLRRRNR